VDILRRWDLVLVDFGSGAEREQNGTRPALVISNDGFNRHFPLATVLPLTKREGKQRRVYSFEVVLPAGSAGNRDESVVMPHQVRTVSRARVIRHLGRLTDSALRASMERRLADHLALGPGLTHEEP
jgi:mRNA-degrading endonuclease toxin of MazEF toxin-antitoxin module